MIRRIDFDRRRIRDLGNDIDTGKRSMAPLIRVEGRNAHEPMHAALGVEDIRRRIRR